MHTVILPYVWYMSNPVNSCSMFVTHPVVLLIVTFELCYPSPDKYSNIHHPSVLRNFSFRCVISFQKGKNPWNTFVVKQPGAIITEGKHLIYFILMFHDTICVVGVIAWMPLYIGKQSVLLFWTYFNEVDILFYYWSFTPVYVLSVGAVALLEELNDFSV
jgi:hypothetical protein